MIHVHEGLYGDYWNDEKQASHLMTLQCTHCAHAEWGTYLTPCMDQNTKLVHNGYLGEMQFLRSHNYKPDRLKMFLVPVVRWLRLPKDVLRLIQTYLDRAETRGSSELRDRNDVLKRCHFGMYCYWSVDPRLGLNGNFLKNSLWQHWQTMMSDEEPEVEFPLMCRVPLRDDDRDESFHYWRARANDRHLVTVFLSAIGKDRFVRLMDGAKMLYYNAARTRLYHHYPGEALQ